MIAQQIINECETYNFNPRKFRDEVNVSWLINDVKRQCNHLNKNQEVNQNG